MSGWGYNAGAQNNTQPAGQDPSQVFFRVVASRYSSPKLVYNAEQLYKAATKLTLKLRECLTCCGLETHLIGITLCREVVTCMGAMRPPLPTIIMILKVIRQ